MKQKAERKARFARHRARGRGRKAFWVLVLAAALILGIRLAQGLGPVAG